MQLECTAFPRGGGESKLGSENWGELVEKKAAFMLRYGKCSTNSQSSPEHGGRSMSVTISLDLSNSDANQHPEPPTRPEANSEEKGDRHQN